ncbi:MAG: Maltogenic alpha-amylase precursor [Candidatus Atribacteria bacterium ADurb.Bin276]|uniref:Maltogenic alpha-amylase n=1 Tax=Candidatus Atribacter allofermentans TaxID=1852833 RepID=A0A1V5SSF7_9BACT|nr:MAG: Maltogenic alpha-amylase precursor [Candidatus Atribacteria bacterium ADurb.Bin276]
MFLVGCTKTPAPTSVTFSISNISPNCGVAGETIIITGTSFGDTQGSSMVTFNGVPATVNSWSNTQIEVLVPSGAITGDVVVRVNGINSNGIRFIIPCYGPMQGMIVDQIK